MVKNLKLFFIIILIVLVIAGCSDTQIPDDQLNIEDDNGVDYDVNDENEINEEEDDNEENTELDLENLSQIFPDQEGFTWFYHGYAEYGHVMSIENIEKGESSSIIKIKGYMNDGMEDPDPNGSRTFTIEYKIDGTSITEHIYNNEFNSNTLNSIIPNKTILMLPLQEGNSWEDTFIIDEESYVAYSVIEEIRSSEEGGHILDEYVVRTKVNGLEDYPNNIYEEKCVYRMGTGLVAFSNTVINGMPFTEDEPFSFGYSLSITEIVQD